MIGTNKRDAQETVDHLVEDLHEGRLPGAADADAGGRWRACSPSARPTT